MSKIEQLDNTRHARLRLLTAHGVAFGEAINQSPVYVSEFEEVQRQYPILFRKEADGNLQPLAILGFERDENLFLDGAVWDGYVPAIIRRGPLLIGRGDNRDHTILVDLDHTRIRDGGDEGTPLFREHGGNAPALEAAMAALNQVHLGLMAAATMQQLFEEAALVEPIKLQVQVTEASAINFEGFLAVSADRIAALDGAQLAKLNQAGFLATAIFAASSLGNMPRLIARKRRLEKAA